MRYSVAAAVLCCGCSAPIVDELGYISASLALATLGEPEAAPVVDVDRRHTRANCPTDGVVEQADGNRVSCPDCIPEAPRRRRLFTRRKQRIGKVGRIGAWN